MGRRCGTRASRSITGSLGSWLPSVKLPDALHLLAQPKARGRGRAAPREPLKTFEASPVTLGTAPVNASSMRLHAASMAFTFVSTMSAGIGPPIDLGPVLELTRRGHADYRTILRAAIPVLAAFGSGRHDRDALE